MSEVATTPSPTGTTKLSVARALAKLKSLKSSIDVFFNGDHQFFYASQGTKEPRMLSAGLTVESAKSKAQGELDKIKSLIDNQRRLKAAIVLSNATTLVTVNGKEYTVSEAIELKTTVASKERLLADIKRQRSALTTSINKANEKMESDLRTGQNNNSSLEGSQLEAYRSVVNLQREIGTVQLVDGINSDAVIDALEKEIEAIKVDLDYVLNQSNIVTEIEVDLS